MAEKKKKKQPRGLRGMPTTSVQSRMPSKTAKGKAGKVSKPKKKYGTGIVGQLAKRRAKRKAEGKWVLGEKLTKAGRKRSTTRQASKRLKKAGVKVSAKTAAASGKVRKGAVGAKVTKGGAYAKYKKGSKAAKSFGATRKAACGGGEGGTFSWDGRSYSCAVAKPTKKQKAARKASALPGGTKKPTAHT